MKRYIRGMALFNLVFLLFNLYWFVDWTFFEDGSRLLLGFMTAWCGLASICFARRWLAEAREEEETEDA